MGKNVLSKVATVSELQAALTELERRIPDLFVGKVCPLVLSEKSCNCTFETGCVGLKLEENIEQKQGLIK